MRRRLILSACLLAAVVVSPLTPRSTHAASMSSVTFSLNWIKNVEFGGLWAGQEKGWWQQAGLDMTAKAWDYTDDPAVLVGAGKYMFGFQDGASLIIARSRGVPVKAIWASGQKSPFCFITMPGSNIKTVKDFRGKRIGYQGHERYVLESMLNDQGMTINDVKPVVVGFDPTLLVAGKVDAYLAYITNEPIELALGHHLKVNIIKASDYGYDFYSDVLFTTDSVIKNHPDLVRKVVSVMDRGWKYAMAHPAEVANYVIKQKLDTQDSVAQQTAEMKALTPLSEVPGIAVGSMTAAKWQYGINLLLKYKQIPASFPVNQVFTTQFLPK